MRFAISLLLACLFAGHAFGQSTPETMDLPSTRLIASDEADEVEQELVRFKKQAIQSLGISTGWLADSGEDLLSSHFLDASIGSGIPLGSFEHILGVKPRFRVDWMDAKDDLDVPEELYEFEVQFFYRRPLRERLSSIAIFSPSVRSDLTTSHRAFRVFALALLNWECIPGRLVLSGGAVYLGRADLPVLPALGLSWTPSSAKKLDLRFPSSRFSYRLAKNGAISEKWAYLDASIGGNTWAVTRNDSSTDQLTVGDWRLTCGLEKIVDGGGGWFVEGGWAFNRRLEYAKDGTEIPLGDGLLVNGGWRY